MKSKTIKQARREKARADKARHGPPIDRFAMDEALSKRNQKGQGEPSRQPTDTETPPTNANILDPPEYVIEADPGNELEIENENETGKEEKKPRRQVATVS